MKGCVSKKELFRIYEFEVLTFQIHISSISLRLTYLVEKNSQKYFNTKKQNQIDMPFLHFAHKVCQIFRRTR
jgi:hypothetical protein